MDILYRLSKRLVSSSNDENSEKQTEKLTKIGKNDEKSALVCSGDVKKSGMENLASKALDLEKTSGDLSSKALIREKSTVDLSSKVLDPEKSTKETEAQRKLVKFEKLPTTMESFTWNSSVSNRKIEDLTNDDKNGNEDKNGNGDKNSNEDKKGNEDKNGNEHKNDKFPSKKPTETEKEQNFGEIGKSFVEKTSKTIVKKKLKPKIETVKQMERNTTNGIENRKKEIEKTEKSNEKIEKTEKTEKSNEKIGSNPETESDSGISESITTPRFDFSEEMKEVERIEKRFRKPERIDEKVETICQKARHPFGFIKNQLKINANLQKLRAMATATNEHVIDTLATLVTEVQEALSANFEGIECTVGPGPDLSSKPFYLSFPHLGKQITFIPDVSHVDNAGFDSTGLHRLTLNKTSAVFTDGQSGAALELVLGKGSDWKKPLIDLFTRLYPSKWAFLVLELEQGNTLFHLLSAASTPITGTGKKEDTPDSVDPDKSALSSTPSESSDQGKTANFTLWIVPVTRIFAIPSTKVVKKVVRRVVKKKSPPVDGAESSTPVVATEKKRVIKKIIKKADGTESVTTETRVEQETAGMGRSPAPSLNGHDVSSALVNGSDKQRMSPIENGEDKKKDSPMTFGYGEISNKRAESPKMNGDLIITNGSTISKERKDALLSKYLNGNGDETQMESVPQTNGHNGYHNENETSIRTLSKLNGDSSGYTSGNSSIDTPNGLDSGPSSSSLLTPSWSSTLTSCSSLSRSPSTSSTIRPEDFDHAASRTRSDRLRQRLASLDRQNGVNGENGITNGSSSILERVSPSRLGTPSSSSILGESDDLTDLRKRLIGLQRDSSFTSSSTINEKFQSALLASRRSSQGPESGQLQPSSSRSRLFDHNRKSRSPPLGPIVEVESADGQKVKNCEICTDPLVNCGCGGKGKRRTSQEIIGFGKHEIRSTTQANGLEPQSQVGTMPFVVLHKVLRKLPYQELARLRAVHPHWDEICGQMLNSGYYQLIEKSDKLLMRLQRLVQKDSGMYYPTSVLTNIQVHILNQVDAMRAALDEGVGCFPYGILLDKTFQLVKQVEEMTNGGKQIDVPWEPVAILAKRASMHYKDNLESIMEERLGESARLKAAQKLIRLDSFLVETSVQKMEKENAKNRDDVMWEVEQLQQCNEKLRKDNRELKQNQMKLEARIDILEQKFKTMARLFS